MEITPLQNALHHLLNGPVPVGLPVVADFGLVSACFIALCLEGRSVNAKLFVSGAVSGAQPPNSLLLEGLDLSLHCRDDVRGEQAAIMKTGMSIYSQ